MSDHRRGSRARPYRYLLGDAKAEAARLRAQARLRDPTAHALFDRLRIRRGWKVLEIRTGHSGSPVWAWLSSYFLGVMSRLADIEPFNADQARRLRRQWIANSRKTTSLLIGPTLIDVVGRRKRSGSL
jgi:hypothetical protein